MAGDFEHRTSPPIVPSHNCDGTARALFLASVSDAVKERPCRTSEFNLGFGNLHEKLSDEQMYAGQLKLAWIAEQLGYDSLWAVEHHLPGDGHERDAVTITGSDLDSLVVVALGGAGCRIGRAGDEFSPRRAS